MTGFLYYLPTNDKHTLNAQEASALGLAYAFDHGRCATTGVSSGPDKNEEGGRALVFADPQHVATIKYDDALQTWIRHGDAADVWVGIWNDQRPGPEDLVRDAKDLISGQWLQLEDGHDWHAPTARRWDEQEGTIFQQHNLPQRLTRNDEGGWVAGGVKPKYQRLWDMAMAYEQAAHEALAAAPEDEDNPTFEFPQVDALAIAALQVNYRVGPAELDLLGVYDDQVRSGILRVLLDTDRLHALVKKKLQEPPSDSSNSAHGPPASTPDSTATTTPPSPT